MRESMKRAEMELRAARRDVINAEETNKRLKEQLKEYVHKVNVIELKLKN